MEQRFKSHADGRVAGQAARRVDAARLHKVGDADLAVAGSRGRRCGWSGRGHEVDVVPVNLVAGIERAGIFREIEDAPGDDLQRRARSRAEYRDAEDVSSKNALAGNDGVGRGDGEGFPSMNVVLHDLFSFSC